MNELLGWLITNSRFTLRATLAEMPALYFALQRLRPSRRHLLVSRETEIVIEGYPRSANTFAVAAFLVAQGRPVKIARHLHVPAQVIQAVRWRIPTLILIRNPEDAVLSLLVREPGISARRVLVDYVRFYRKIQAYYSHFVLATFEGVTTDFGAVIEKVNEKFETNFKPFAHTDENVAKVIKIVEEMDKADQRKENVTETTVARPSEIRTRLKEKRRKELANPHIERLLREAKAVYQEMIELDG